jgi:hypothetical protein
MHILIRIHIRIYTCIYNRCWIYGWIQIILIDAIGHATNSIDPSVKIDNF